MAKILFLSDTHLGHDLPIRKATRAHRGEDFFVNFEKILDKAIKDKVSMVIHGGDLFFRARIPEAIVNRVYKILYEFSNTGILFIIVPGNHERSRFPRSPLFNREGIFCFNYPRTFRFDLEGIKVSVSGFPYHSDNVRDQFGLLLREAGCFEPEKPDYNFLLIHHAVEGCTCGPGNYTFRHAEDVIQMSNIPDRFDAVLCGHIHRQQELFKMSGDRKIPVLYAGSTERTSFAEMKETKGYYLLEPTINPIGKKEFTYHFVPVESRPMFHYEIAPEAQISKKEVHRPITQTSPNGSMVKIRISNPQHLPVVDNDMVKELESADYFIQVSSPYRQFTPKKKKEHRPGLFG